MARPLDLAPTDLAGYEAARRALSDRLVTWAQATGRQLHPQTGEQLIHYKWGYLDDHLARWRRADLDAVLLELFPAKVMMNPDETDEIVTETRVFLRFLSETGHLDPAGDNLATLWRHVGRIAPELRHRLGDRSLFSWGKAMWLAMAKEGIGPDNPEAALAWRERFDALSLAEREQVIDGPMCNLPAWAGPGRFSPFPLGPTASPSPQPGRRGSPKVNRQ